MRPLLLSTPEHAALATSVRTACGMNEGVTTRELFPDGECHQRIETSVDGRDVVLIASATDDASTARLFDLCCGLASGGAASLTLVLTYFAYATMDREAAPGDVVTARTRALLLSSSLRPPGGLRVLLIEPHTDALPFYFAPHVRTGVIDVSRTIQRLCRDAGETGFVMASTDAGRVKAVQRLAEALGVPAAIAHKQRLGPARTRVVALLGDVRGRRVVLHDDMVRSGSSLLGAARACLEAGATGVSAVVTHAVLPGDSLERIRSAGLIERLLVTDTHPAVARLAGEFLRVESIAADVAAALGDHRASNITSAGTAVSGTEPPSVDA